MFQGQTIETLKQVKSTDDKGSIYKYQQQKMSAVVRSSFIKRANTIEQAQIPNIQKLIKRSSLSIKKCPLCEEQFSKSDMDSVGNCNHIFCRFCLQKYCVYKISVMQTITCPQQGCTTTIQQGGNIFGGLPQDSKSKYKIMMSWKKTIDNPNLKLCPTEKCDGIIDISNGNFQCEKCKIQFCKECQLALHQGPCDINFQQNFKDWKRCPKCQMFIQKNEGCNHMTCLCSHQFCYVCLSNWEDSHYECQIQHPPQICGRRISQAKCCQRIGFFILLMVLFPIYIAFMLFAGVLMLASYLLVSIFYSPYLFRQKCICPIVIFIILIPFIMVFGILVGFFISLYQIAILFKSKIKSYCSLLVALTSGQDANNNNQHA